jgi:SPP1 gp7 family putative phage head morphogenesis protein
MAKKPVKEVAEPQEKPATETALLAAGGSKNPIEDLYIGVAEQTYKRSSYVPESFKMPYNPDDIYQKKGNYSIYEDMMYDDQVSICSNLKKDLILGSGWSLVADEDDQHDMCKELQESIEDSSDTTFTDKLREILDAYEKGFSLTEKVFQIMDNGWLALKDLFTRHPNSWLIYQDDKGNITKFEQKTAVGDLSINPKSLIHYINNAKYQNPYGTSDLRAAYNAWFTKRQVIRWYAMFLEANAKPIPVGRYDVNSPPGTADELLEILKGFQAKTAITIPRDIEVDFLEAKSNGEAYHKALNIFNMFIGRSMFIPDLLGMSGSETAGGSLALGKEQMNIFFMHINRRRATLEKLVQRHIIKPLVVYNYGNVPIPKFKFNPLNDSEAVELAKVWLDLVKAKVAKVTEEEVNHFRKLVKFPEGDVELIAPVEPAELGDDGLPLRPETDKDGNPLPNKRVEKDASNKDPIDAKDAEIDEKMQKDFAKIYNLPPGEYHRKCDFKAIAAKLNDYDKSVVAETAPVVKKMYADLYEQLKKKNILTNQDISKVDSINLKYRSELKKLLKQSFMSIYKDGQVQAAHELNKSDFKTPTTSQEFLDLLDQETFAYIGKYEYGIKEKVRQQLVAAIKDGLPLSNVIDTLDNEGKRLSEVSLERFARTKHTEVLNRGRLAYFEESGVVAAYQYSAILDDRTSDICAGLDGKIFVAGTQPVPPMHFNCRSLLIAITKYEEFKPSEKVGKKDIEEFIDENKGDSFARFSLADDFTTEHLDDCIDVITYSRKGIPFETITIKYSDNTHKEVLSKITRAINAV